MIYFIIFYLIVGILLAVENYKADLIEGIESTLNDYKWLPLNWFFILVFNVFRNDGDDGELGV